MSLQKPASLVKPPSLLDLRDPQRFDEPIIPPPSLAWRVFSIAAVLVSIGGSALAVWMVAGVLANWSIP